MDRTVYGSALAEFPVGAAVVLVQDHRGRTVSNPHSALLRFESGWRSADRDDDGPPAAGALFRVLWEPLP